MKGFINILIFIFFSIPVFADTIIEMEEYGGVYRIPCTVNGAKMKFIFDTGASNVCLSLPMAEYLYDNGYLEKSDIKGTGSSSVADGRIVDHVILNLKDIEIGGQHLYNVKAIVIDGQNAPLLMGQSAIQKLGSFKLDGKKLILNSMKDDDKGLTQEEIDEMFDLAYDYYNNGRYNKAFEIYSTLNEYLLLSDYGKYLLGTCAKETQRYREGIKVMESIIDYDSEKYMLLGYLYLLEVSREDGVYFFNKALEKAKTYYDAGEIYYNLGNAFATGSGGRYKTDFSKGLEYYKRALDNFGIYYGLNSGDALKYAYNNINHLDSIREKCSYLDFLIYGIADISWLEGLWSYDYVKSIMKYLSNNGVEQATKWITRH